METRKLSVTPARAQRNPRARTNTTRTRTQEQDKKRVPKHSSAHNNLFEGPLNTHDLTKPGTRRTVSLPKPLPSIASLASAWMAVHPTLSA